MEVVDSPIVTRSAIRPATPAPILRRERVAQLAELTVPSAKVGRVRLDNLVEFHAGTGPARINRHSRQRQVSLYGNIIPGHAFGDILNDIMHQAALLACRPRTPSRGCPPARTPLTVAGRSRRSGC